MRTVEVCYTPDLLHLYDLEGKIVVVADVLRATSCMVSGLANGVKQIIPVATQEEVIPYREQGFIVAGERNGKKVEGFDIGNSPFSFMEDRFYGKSIVMTTTNGTVSIHKSKPAKQVIIGALLNVTAVGNYLKKREEDIIILCAGWKGKFNLEDSLFAGALIDRICHNAAVECDAGLSALIMYNAAQEDLLTLLQNSSHVSRLSRLNGIADVKFCVQEDKFDTVPVLVGDALVKLNVENQNGYVR